MVIYDFLKDLGFNEKIIKHVKNYNIEKQLEKLKNLPQEDIQQINEYLLKIDREELIFPLFYASICKIDIVLIEPSWD